MTTYHTIITKRIEDSYLEDTGNFWTYIADVTIHRDGTIVNIDLVGLRGEDVDERALEITDRIEDLIKEDIEYKDLKICRDDFFVEE